MADPEYILVSDVADNADMANISVKAIADLSSGDYIIACDVDDNAYVSNLFVLPYDDTNDAGVPQYAIGSTTSSSTAQSDLRVIELDDVSGGGWVDMIPDLSANDGIISGGEITAEVIRVEDENGEVQRAHAEISVDFTGTVVGTSTKLKLAFSTYKSDLTFGWSNGDFWNPVDDTTTVTSNPFIWVTAWDGDSLSIQGPTIYGPTQEEMDDLVFVVSQFKYYNG